MSTLDSIRTSTTDPGHRAFLPTGVLPGNVMGPILVGLVFAALLVATWGRWAELIVDFGRELYVPWRIAEGDILYRDLAYFNGPLSPHINALLFHLMGPGIQTILLFNLVVLILFTGAAYYILFRLTGPIPATVSCCSFLVLCAFSQFMIYGGYNFLAPYSHELTHGLLITAIGLLFLRRVGQGAVFSALAVGVCVGLALLTKPEIALAAAGSMTVGLGLAISGSGWLAKKRLVACVLFVTGLGLPAAGFAVVPAGYGLSWTVEAVLSPWIALVEPNIRALPFYRSALGLHDPWGSLFWIGVWSGLWVGLIGGPYWLFSRLPRRLQGRPTIGWWSFTLTLPFALITVLFMDGLRAFGPLPLLMAIILLGSLSNKSRCHDRFRHGDWVLAVSGILFSLLLLGKLGLRPQVVWYGFALAAPALLAGIAWLFGPLPRRLDQRGGAGAVAMGSASAVLLSIMAPYVAGSAAQYLRRSTIVGDGTDKVFVEEARARAISPALASLSQMLQPGERLLVVPEGVSINYLLRTQSPTPFYNFMPPELILYGEERIIAALEMSPPAFVLFIPKWTGDYGGEFGKAFGVQLAQWIEDRYSAMMTFTGGDFFGIRFDVVLFAPRLEVATGRPAGSMLASDFAELHCSSEDWQTCGGPGAPERPCQVDDGRWGHALTLQAPTDYSSRRGG